MLNIFLIIGILISILLTIFLILGFREYLIKNPTENTNNKISLIESSLIRLENNLRDEIHKSNISSIDLMNNRLNELNLNLNSSLNSLRNQLTNDSKLNRDEISNSFDKISKSLEKELNNLNNTQNQLISSTEKKLDIMRDTVDEKLQKTLESRISQSFKFVSERLEVVHQGIGEMNNLALSVNDLKKILSNVKTRGIVGEYQLENILTQILNEKQYFKNVITKQNSNDRVEFAIKIPTKDTEKNLLLPIDSKFPIENYSKLIDAYDSLNQQEILKYSKELESSIKKFAKDISNKYIDSYNTTDFAILFLPFEGLYSEISKRTTLIEYLQREYKIIVTGPTTLYALLNSLNLAFKTLSIEKHSSNVWKILGEVKTEFETFSNVLEKAKDKLEQATKDLDSLSTTRTKQIQKKLKDVELIDY